jgi:hypothetical protein
VIERCAADDDGSFQLSDGHQIEGAFIYWPPDAGKPPNQN